jgi:hypothetical protein
VVDPPLSEDFLQQLMTFKKGDSAADVLTGGTP